MSLFQTITQKAGEAGLPFLVIGGYAVMAHGFVRATDDLDLLVQGSRRDQWRQLLEGLGMKLFHEAPVFMQFEPAPTTRIPVDLMFVSEEVFEKMRADAKPAGIEGARFGVVSLLHLIALKCHAFQHGKRLRGVQDMEDLIQLINRNGLNLNDPGLRAMIVKHGNQELYERLRRASASG